MSKTLPPDAARTSAHNIRITPEMGDDVLEVQIDLRKKNRNKPKRSIALIIGDRVWESLEARKVLQADEQNTTEKMKELYRLFQIQDPNAPTPKKK